MDETIFKAGVLEIKYFPTVKLFNDIWYKNGYGYFIVCITIPMLK